MVYTCVGVAMVPMCWGGVAGYGIYPCVGVEELAMVPMCCGGVAGYGTHVLWWSSHGYGTHVLGWSSWLWYPCVGVE